MFGKEAGKVHRAQAPPGLMGLAGSSEACETEALSALNAHPRASFYSGQVSSSLLSGPGEQLASFRAPPKGDFPEEFSFLPRLFCKHSSHGTGWDTLPTAKPSLWRLYNVCW